MKAWSLLPMYTCVNSIHYNDSSGTCIVKLLGENSLAKLKTQMQVFNAEFSKSKIYVIVYI